MAYRVLAWVVGINLILVMTGFIGQLSTDDTSWFNTHDGLISAIDVAHGWLFMVLIVLVVALGRKYRWTIPFTATTAILATIPFVSFWAEHRATKAVRAATP